MELYTGVILFVGFIIGVTVHETAHAWMADKLGDPTAKNLGRISFNPLRHIDPIGTILLPLIGLISSSHALVGWAKPTPFNPANLKDVRKDEVLISLAGPISDIMLAVACLLIVKGILLLRFLINLQPAWPVLKPIFFFLYIVALENVWLAFFNLLPIPPLDGASLLRAFLPQQFAYHLSLFNRYGFILLLVLYSTPLGGAIGTYIDFCTHTFFSLFGLAY